MSDLKERIEKAARAALGNSLCTCERCREHTDAVIKAVLAAIDQPSAPKPSPLPWREGMRNGMPCWLDANGNPVFFNDGPANRALVLHAVNSHEQAVKLAKSLQNMFDWCITEDEVIVHKNSLIADYCKDLLRAAGELG
jgi:hypothetical protein